MLQAKDSAESLHQPGPFSLSQLQGENDKSGDPAAFPASAAASSRDEASSVSRVLPAPGTPSIFSSQLSVPDGQPHLSVAEVDDDSQRPEEFTFGKPTMHL